MEGNSFFFYFQFGKVILKIMFIWIYLSVDIDSKCLIFLDGITTNINFYVRESYEIPTYHWGMYVLEASDIMLYFTILTGKLSEDV